MFNFEKLILWHKTLEFAEMVNLVTQGLPDKQRVGFANQMRSVALSISSNMVEGSSSNSRPEYARFIEIAIANLLEVVSRSAIGLRHGFLSKEDHWSLYAAAKEQSRILRGL